MTYDRRAFKRVRLQRRVSVTDVAERVGMSERALRAIDRGVAIPRADTLARLANALRVSVGMFYSRRERG